MSHPLSSRPSASSHTRPGATGEHPWDVYANGVRLIALRALSDPAAADDIAQEAITRGMSALAAERGHAIGDLRAFIYGIARHLIADAYRAHARTIPLDEVAEPPAAAPNALDAAIDAEERSRVQAVIRDLPERDRLLLNLFFVEGLDTEAVAARMGDSAVNVRKRKSRALERVRHALRGHDTAPTATDS